MTTYVILSRFSPEAFSKPGDFRGLAAAVSEEIRTRCPGVVWKDSYAALGQYDVVDVVEAGEPKEVERAAMVLRGQGHSTTETLLTTSWRTFLESLE